jgi:hypothetical protein
MTPNVQNFKTLQTFARIGEPTIDLLLQGRRFGQRFCACVPLWPAHLVKHCGALKKSEKWKAVK